MKGKVKLPHFRPPPPNLRSLFFDKHLPISKRFHENIRQYNNMFSFTSMGGKIDHSKNSGSAPYSFVLSGVNYHHIGSLLPSRGEQAVFSQLYIYDTANEVENRISAVRYAVYILLLAFLFTKQIIHWKKIPFPFAANIQQRLQLIQILLT